MAVQDSPAAEPHRHIAAHWFGILGPPLAGFAQQQLTYVLVDHACRSHAVVLLHLPALLGFGVVGLASYLAGKEWRRGGDNDRFFAVVAWVMSGVATALILAQWLPTAFLHPCLR
jgi:hypothetical protein